MQLHQLDHMQTLCTSLQTDNHANTSALSFYRPVALLDAQPTVFQHSPLLLWQAVSELWWLSGGKVGILSELLYAVWCTTVVQKCALWYAHKYEQSLNLWLASVRLVFVCF